ncbi:hypothetical protein Pint_14392 [Pistacia integerrima]|uniref:Uncharacterized protein n=1 Tax=Pistacia integerrima TaxID=434235 RepID=A0ACC0Y4L7_9ROSI|nr:hypothetical protein Pint_14392 [Pistacia integerrima]
MLNISIARLVHLYGKDSKTLSADAKLYSLKEYKNQTFYVSFKIGQPPVPQIALMDTGSDFIWIKCFDQSGEEVEGIIAKELFTFGSPDEDKGFSIEDVVFGCNLEYPIFADKVNGIFGLATHRSSYSLVMMEFRLGDEIMQVVGGGNSFFVGHVDGVQIRSVAEKISLNCSSLFNTIEAS